MYRLFEFIKVLAGETFINYSVFGNLYLRLGKRPCKHRQFAYYDISLRGQF